MSRAQLVLPANADRAEWLALRRTGLGGSDMAAVVGLDTYRSPFAVWHDKAFGGDGEDAGEAAQMGNDLEDVVARLAANRAGVKIRNTGTWRSTVRPWQLANPDRLIVGGGILEIKTAAGGRADDWQNGQLVPERHHLQAQHYMDVLDADRTVFGALLAPPRGGMRLRLVELRRDDELIAELRAIGEEFWERVQNREAPPPDGDPRTTRLIARMYEVAPDSVVDLDDQAATIAQLRELYDIAALQEKHAARAKREAQQRALMLLGDKAIGRIDGRVVLRRTDIAPTEIPATTRAGYTRLTFAKGKSA